MLLSLFPFALLPAAFAYPGVQIQNHPRDDRKCSDLRLPSIPGIQIISVHGADVRNFSYPIELPFNPNPISGINFCNVTVTFTHEKESDIIYASVWLPITNWNGRFQAVGGGGLSAGIFESSLVGAIGAGYAAAGSEGGLSVNHTLDPLSGNWLTKSDKTYNTALVRNYASRSAHDSSVVGKAVLKAFYGRGAEYSYWNGCSNGGRQGYFEAEQYPEDFDGILAESPGVNLPYVIANHWPQVVMANSIAVPQCVFQAYQDDILTTCDPLDGVKDGLISDTRKCIYDSHKLVGVSVACPTGNVTISEAYAEVVLKILQGPRTSTGKQVWYGLPPGSPFEDTANTTVINGILTPVPNQLFVSAISNMFFKNSSYDISHMTSSEYTSLFDTFSSIPEIALLLSPEKPDLSAFQRSGGKLLTVHGMSDVLVSHEGTVLYRDRLAANMGGNDNVDEFYRLFLAPGVGHCGGGIGPAPLDPLKVLVDWVEEDIVPDTLAAETNSTGKLLTRNLCRYPLLLTYKGTGNVNDANSFFCK